MSQLLPEIDVEVVKLVVTKKDNADTLTYYFAQDYWATSTLYSGNPEILPLLVSSPNVRRSVGNYAGIRHDVGIQLYGKTSMTVRGKSLFDIFKDYEIHSASATVYYYARPLGAITTHADATNTRQVLKVGDMSYSEDGAIFNLRARGVFFKDKEVSRKLDATTLSGLDLKYDGEYGAIVFGEATTTANGIMIDAPIFDSKISSGKPNMKVFSGWTFPSHPNKAFKRLMVRNRHKQQDENEWVEVDLPADPQTNYAGDTDITAGVSSSLATTSRGVAYSPDNGGKSIICSLISCPILQSGTLASTDGNAQCTISFGQVQGTGFPWVPTGGSLKQEVLNCNNVTILVGSGSVHFQISPPLVMTDSSNYFIRIEFTNKDDVTNYLYTFVIADSGWTHFSLDRSESDRTWATETDVRLPIGIYAVGDGDDAFKDGMTSGTKRYSYYHLEGKIPVVETGDTQEEIDKELEFKIGVTGLKDDGSGTYTGTASATIENPSDIIRFTLMNSDFGLGLSSTYVNTSTLDSVRTSSATTKLKIVIDRETTAEQLINEVCRQSRIIYYQQRDGKIALYYPSPISTLTANLSQAAMGGDLQLVSVSDNDYSSVVNDFRQYYKPDILNQPTDPALLRRDAREKLAGLVEMNGTTSTSADTYRQGLCSLSEAKFGKRQMAADLGFYDSSSAAQEMVNYNVDRYSQLQKRVVFRVPRRDYMSTLDLFSTVRVNHLGIPASDGTSLPAKKHYAGDGITDYAENVPGVAWAGGVIDGQIYEVQEQGPWMILTAETVGVFK